MKQTRYVRRRSAPGCYELPSKRTLEFANTEIMTDKTKSWLRSTFGRTPVFGRRTDPVLRSACSRRVTTVGKPSAAGQPTRITQPFIFQGR